MKKTTFIFFHTVLLSLGAFAAAPAFRITPFTGTDYMRITVDAGFRTSIASRFKLVIRDRNGNNFWSGAVTAVNAVNVDRNVLSFTVSKLKPVLWQPVNPYLYTVSLEQYTSAGKLIGRLTERAGFRSFERRGGNLFLNGKPIFLRGIAINPPGRGIPDHVEQSREFALEYVAYMKSLHVNIIRIPDAEEWYDVCDELGMMVFGGNYSGKVAAGEKVSGAEQVGDETDGGFPKDYDKGVSWYENDKLGAIAHHPSLMVYAMTNETPFAGERAAAWEKFLDYSYHKLKSWDETRVYIANAGYGYGKTGDICDIHRYWGWYYSSPFTFLHIRNNAEIIPFPKTGQPVTFTECVGNYTGPDGRYNLTPAHKNPSSQLAWTGHAAQDLQAGLADEHQAFTFRSATETFRQLRDVNPDLSGVFPFTILFYNWDTVQKFADMGPKPVTVQVKRSYQPVLLSWENWTPNVFAGGTVQPTVHVINDADDFSDLQHARVVYLLRDKTKTTIVTDSLDLPLIPYYGAFKRVVDVKIPENCATGDYELIGRIISGGRIVSENYSRFFIASQRFTRSAKTVPAVMLYDPQGTTTNAFAKLGIRSTNISSFNTLTTGTPLVIGENAADAAVGENVSALRKFVADGGRLLVLRQDSLHRVQLNKLLLHPVSNGVIDIDNPVYPLSPVPPRNGYSVNPERPEHAVFAGIGRDNLRHWSDYTGWNETKAGFPKIQPVTDGFTLLDKTDVGYTAILANYGSGLQGIALAEQFQGKGSVLVSGFDLAGRADVDPVAQRLLLNLVSYAGDAGTHENYPLVTAPIRWGDYDTELGLVTDLYSGFLVSSTPRLPDTFTKGIGVTKEGYQLAGGSRSGFNTRPGIQYVANGRRPFGPFVQSFGGQPTPEKGTTVGTATFWCRVPDASNRMSNLVWNPGNEDISLTININGRNTMRTLHAGEKTTIDLDVDSPIVHVTFTGDRRAVILETSFYAKN